MKLLKKSLFILYVLTLTSVTSSSFSRGMQIFDGPPTAPQCRNCHYDLERFPMLGLNLGIRNPDRHHLLIGSIIPPISRSKAPDAVGAKDSGALYECFSCHVMKLDLVTLENEFIEPFRDCLQCHPAWIVTGGPGGMGGRGGANGTESEIGNVHMDQNPLFLQRQCRVCHTRGGGRR